MSKKLVIIGASGHGKVIADIAKKNGYHEIVFLDDNETIHEVNGYTHAMADPFRRISCEAIDKIKVNWEAMELIKDLRNQGCKIALCTGKDHYRTVDILKYYHVDDLFDILVCADDVTEPKPSAVPILEVIKCLGCKKDDVIMIGDGYNDVLSAKNAGVKSILTLWYGDFGVPREADTTVSNVSELSYIICEVKKK